MKDDEYYAGKGCKCMAFGESECGCDADWTDPEIYKLRDENKKLKEQNELMIEALEKYALLIKPNNILAVSTLEMVKK